MRVGVGVTAGVAVWVGVAVATGVGVGVGVEVGVCLGVSAGGTRRHYEARYFGTRMLLALASGPS